MRYVEHYVEHNQENIHLSIEVERSRKLLIYLSFSTFFLALKTDTDFFLEEGTVSLLCLALLRAKLRYSISSSDQGMCAITRRVPRTISDYKVHFLEEMKKETETCPGTA